MQGNSAVLSLETGDSRAVSYNIEKKLNKFLLNTNWLNSTI